MASRFAKVLIGALFSGTLATASLRVLWQRRSAGALLDALGEARQAILHEAGPSGSPVDQRMPLAAADSPVSTPLGGVREEQAAAASASSAAASLASASAAQPRPTDAKGERSGGGKPVSLSLSERRGDAVPALRGWSNQTARLNASEGSAAVPRLRAAPRKPARASEGLWGSSGWQVVSLATLSPFQFNRCAVIGSSKDLLGKGLGAEIEEHDTVIRVNRIPPEHLGADFGQRTDVLFVGVWQNHKRTYTKEGQAYTAFGGDQHWCSWTSTTCPFRMVVLRGWAQPWRQPPDARIAVAEQSERMHNFAVRLVHNYFERPFMPTTGFEAFVTFGLLCNSTTLYGFSGGETADGHKFHGVHSVNQVLKEHELMRLLLAGKYEYGKYDRKKLARLKDSPSHPHRIV